MRHILHIPVRSITKLSTHLCRKDLCIFFGITAIVFECPVNVAIAKVISLQGKGNSFDVIGIFALCFCQAVWQFMCPTVYAFLCTVDRRIHIIIRLRCLHHIRRISSTLLLDHGKTQIHIIINTIFFTILWNHLPVTFCLFRYLCLIGSTLWSISGTTGTDNSTDCPDNHSKQNNDKQHDPHDRIRCHWPHDALHCLSKCFCSLRSRFCTCLNRLCRFLCRFSCSPSLCFFVSVSLY